MGRFLKERSVSALECQVEETGREQWERDREKLLKV